MLAAPLRWLSLDLTKLEFNLHLIIVRIKLIAIQFMLLPIRMKNKTFCDSSLVISARR